MSKENYDVPQHNFKLPGIFFLEDWDKRPNAYIDYETKNTSFLELANVLHQMGIKNHLFFLATLDPRLKDIDPQSPDLTQEEIAIIVMECKNNIWYFFREVLRAPPSSGLKPIPFKMNRATLAYIWVFYNRIISYLVMGRQQGKSFNLLSLITYLLTIGTANSNINLLTTNNTLRAETMITLKKLLNVLPPYLKLLSKWDTQNTEKLTVGLTKNSFRISVGRASAEDADRAGRGLTSSLIFIDEIAYIKNIDITYPVALSSSGAARESARQNGYIYGFGFTTTAGKLSTDSGKFAYKRFKGSTTWSETFYDARDNNHLRKIVATNSPSAKGRLALTVAMTFSHLQLGFTDEWLKERIALSGSEGIDIETDYLNRWVNASQSGLLTPEEMNRLHSGVVHEPIVFTTNTDYVLTSYVSDLSRYYHEEVVIGCDTSDASGSDEIGLVMLSPITGEVIATGTYNETNLITFAEYIVDLLITFKKSILIIERKSSAVTMLDHIISLLTKRGIDPFKRIFNKYYDGRYDGRDVVELESKQLSRRGDEDYAKVKKVFGFTTTGSGRYARSNLYGFVIKNAVMYVGNRVKDKKIVTQMASLVVKNNRLDHKAGDHDDLLFAYLLAIWFLLQGNNKDKYGINPLSVLSDTGMKNDNKEREEAAEEVNKVNEVNKLLVDFNNAITVEDRYRIKSKLEMLKKDIDMSKLPSLTTEQSLQKIDQSLTVMRSNGVNTTLLSHMYR